MGTNCDINIQQSQYNLDRFLIAQEQNYSIAERELRNGRKDSHWMWYIFPQLRGLGMSDMSNYYGIANIEEAKQYLSNDTLRNNLENLATILLDLPIENPVQIFGIIDAEKLNSCMTLFAEAAGKESVFNKVIDKFFGHKDQLTLDILNNQKNVNVW